MNVRHVDAEPRNAALRAALRAGAVHVLVRPALWWPALVAVSRFSPRGWWHRPPFLPVPDARYWRFRMETAYGDECATIEGHELDDVLRWSRRAGTHRR